MFKDNKNYFTAIVSCLMNSLQPWEQWLEVLWDSMGPHPAGVNKQTPVET